MHMSNLVHRTFELLKRRSDEMRLEGRLALSVHYQSLPSLKAESTCLLLIHMN